MIISLYAAITALAVARLTRLVTTDYVFAGPRARLINRLGVTSKGAYLVTCPWCMSLYIAAVAAPAAYWWHASPWFLIPAAALAASHVVGILASLERD